MNRRKEMARNIAKSLMFAISEYNYRFDRNPAKIFAELDAYYAMKDYFVMNIFDDKLKICGIPVERIEKPGIRIYLSGAPVTIREFKDPGVRLIIPKEDRDGQ